MRHLIKLILLLMVTFISSCSSSIEGEQGVKMDVLLQNNNKHSDEIVVKKISNYQGLNSEFVRTQSIELHNRFPKLPNPVLNIFVYPHLTKDNNPVPGYTTNFTLYKSDQYALPNEVY